MSTTRVVNIRTLLRGELPPNHVYIGRANRIFRLAGSKWSNPFVIGPECSRDQAVEAYDEYIQFCLRRFPERYDLAELRGQTLVCYCSPARCHGDVLARLCDAPDDARESTHSDERGGSSQ
jgi:hypothetical protein